MDTIGKFFQFVKEIYLLPLQQYNYNYGLDTEVNSRDWFSTIVLGALIYGLTALVTVLLCIWPYNQLAWLIKRQRCQHAECGHQWTTDVADATQPGCVAGHPCCGSCVRRHSDDALQRRIEQEPKLACPSCQHQMAKLVERGIVLDSCNHCGGVFLDKDEKRRLSQLIRKEGYDDGYGDGRSSGSSSGMVTGLVIGSALN